MKLKDITGQQFGELRVLHRSEHNLYNHTAWVCECSCGNISVVASRALVTGNTKSCGCGKEKAGITRRNNLEGKRFGGILVISPAYTKNNLWFWNVQCDCGNIKVVRGRDLTSGRIVSCGCYRDEKSKQRLYIHGKSNTKEYKSFYNRKKQERYKTLDRQWTPEMESLLSNIFPRCVVCGMTDEDHILEYGTRLHTDHVRPARLNFGLKPGNAVRLCSHCNCTKSGKDLSDLPTDWREKIVFASNVFKVEWDKYISQKEIRNNV